MRSPDCTQHGSLMLDLALGNLSDEAAAAAEAALESCSTCESWWKVHLAGPESNRLDQEVAEVFARFEPPRQSRVSDRYPWAVAAVLALAASFVLQPDRAKVPEAERAAEKEPLLVEEMFNSDANNDGVIDLDDIALVARTDGSGSVIDPAPVFGDGLESGDLSDWATSGLSTEPGSES